MACDEAGKQPVDPQESLTGGAVVQLLLSKCTADGLATLLTCEVGDMRSAAIVCLGLKGAMEHCEALAVVLQEEDPHAVQLAENSLWQIWMRSGSSYGNTLLARAIDLIRRERFEQAAHVLGGLCTTEPRFAEAHNQRGIALCFLDRPEDAAHAFRRALRMNRHHFSAALSLGHTYAERCDLRGALRHYRYALRLHPRLEGIPEVVRQLETVLAGDSISH